MVVHAPQDASDDAVRKVVESKRQWLYGKINHPAKYQGLAHPPGKELVNGESALYLGQEYPIALAETASDGVEFALRFLIPACHSRKGVLGLPLIFVCP